MSAYELAKCWCERSEVSTPRKGYGEEANPGSECEISELSEERVEREERLAIQTFGGG